MALHGNQSKTEKQLKHRREKPSRQKRLFHRAAFRKGILDAGKVAPDVIKAAEAKIAELKTALKTCAPDKQTEIEGKISAQHEVIAAAKNDARKAESLEKKLAGYRKVTT